VIIPTLLRPSQPPYETFAVASNEFIGGVKKKTEYHVKGKVSTQPR